MIFTATAVFTMMIVSAKYFLNPNRQDKVIGRTPCCNLHTNKRTNTHSHTRTVYTLYAFRHIMAKALKVLPSANSIMFLLTKVINLALFKTLNYDSDWCGPLAKRKCLCTCIHLRQKLTSQQIILHKFNRSCGI